MNPFVRLFGIACVFGLALVAWLTLGGVTAARTDSLGSALSSRVQELWGAQQSQRAPSAQFAWNVPVQREEPHTNPQGVTVVRTITVQEPRYRDLVPNQTRINADLRLDERRKGLMWFPLYDVDFSGAWSFPIEAEVPANAVLYLSFQFPDTTSQYDAFTFVVNGQDVARSLRTEHGNVIADLPGPFAVGDIVTLGITYRTRGMTEWRYVPSTEVSQVEDFQLTMRTDFAKIDFPAMTLSPTTKERAGDGWTLAWTFSRLVTGQSIGMVMPTRIQPGELASMLSFSAPIPLALYFVWIYVLGLLRKYEIHPVNYLFLAAGFFAFNLLFAYTADLLPLEYAFALASAVSVLLSVSYLRLVVGSRFAFVEAGIAQMLYQVGFGAAHFFDGLTGLTITVLGILTLFALMQLTGRIKWNEAFASADPKPA